MESWFIDAVRLPACLNVLFLCPNRADSSSLSLSLGLYSANAAAANRTGTAPRPGR